MAIQGLGGLRKKMAAIPALIEKRGAEAMEKSADEIVAMMKRLCPVDQGDLRDSIGWTWGDAPKGSFTVLKSQKGDFEYNGMRITIFAGDEVAFYAHFVEFGTLPHNVAKGGGTVAGRAQLASGGGTGHPGSPARPFFYPSYRALRRRTRSRITRSTRQALKEVAAMPNGN